MKERYYTRASFRVDLGITLVELVSKSCEMAFKFAALVPQAVPISLHPIASSRTRQRKFEAGDVFGFTSGNENQDLRKADLIEGLLRPPKSLMGMARIVACDMEGGIAIVWSSCRNGDHSRRSILEKHMWCQA